MQAFVEDKVKRHRGFEDRLLHQHRTQLHGGMVVSKRSIGTKDGDVGGIFTFRVVNTVEHRQALNTLLKTGGIGIANLKRRLELLYPCKHEIILNQQDCCYEAILKLDLE